MSDLEDENVILDDIKALQAVLTTKEFTPLKKEVITGDPIEHNQDEPSTFQVSNFCLPTSKDFSELTAVDPLLDAEDSENECNDDEDNLDLSDPEAALNLNRKIVNLLSITQKRLQLLLKECKRRQALIEQKIRQRTSYTISRTLLTVAGIPYFKDKQHFPAPKNEDAKLKASRGELQIIDLPCPLRWTLKDRNILWEAIYWNAKICSQEESKPREGNSVQLYLNNPEDPLKLDLNHGDRRIPDEMIQDFKNLVGPLGSREFDWLKIAATDFNGRHSDNECRAMWNVFLHPDINKGKWKKTEDANLKLLAEEYNFQNWDAIASRLNTNRTGYQCFIRFNTNFRNNMFNKVSSWTKEEDQKLTDIVNTLRTGNFIPWGEVAKLMGQRRKQQIYMRWNYSLAPNLKKGRFTEEEDKLLLQGVRKFGTNFTKISISLLPHRTTAQLNDHYRTLLNEKKNKWTFDDDVKLVKLVGKFGKNWSAIAKEFSNKSRVQVRHRHTAILRYLNRGLSIRTIPRWGKKTQWEPPEDESALENEIFVNMSEFMQPEEKDMDEKEQISNIDLELRNYFKGIYPTSTKPGRSKKFYSPEELSERTRKLYVILNMLKANLDIPDDLEQDSNLSTKDTQLLYSLKEYLSNKSSEFEVQQKIIESTRAKMFGIQVPVTDADRFIPPLPFNGKIQKVRKKKLVGINYNSDGHTTLIELDKKFETPETIISLIGGWDQELEFQKMEKKFIGEGQKSPEFIDASNELCKKLVQSSLEEHSSLQSNWTMFNSVDAINSNAPSTSAVVSDSSMDVTQQRISSTNELPSHSTHRKFTKYYPEVLIPPNYTTLLGFRGILLSKFILEAKEPVEDEYENRECKMTSEGQEALKLLEERLVKLFKFPIEFSEVAPPLLHGSVRSIDQDFNDFDDNSNSNTRKKRKAGNDCSKPEAKRKTRCERAHDAEIFEV